MSNSARGTGEPLLIGSEASCIIMGRASLLSHCGSSRVTRRKEGEKERKRKEEKKKAVELASEAGWVLCCAEGGGHGSSQQLIRASNKPPLSISSHTQKEHNTQASHPRIKPLCVPFLLLVTLLIHSLKLDLFAPFSELHSAEISSGALVLCNGKVITSVKTLCQHSITREFNDNSLCLRAIMQKKSNWAGFGVLV